VQPVPKEGTHRRQKVYAGVAKRDAEKNKLFLGKSIRLKVCNFP